MGGRGHYSVYHIEKETKNKKQGEYMGKSKSLLTVKMIMTIFHGVLNICKIKIHEKNGISRTGGKWS